MATTEITVEAFETALAECADAIVASDYQTAFRRYAVAEVIMAGLTVQSGEQDAYMRRRESLAEVRNALKDLEAVDSRTGSESRIVIGVTQFPGASYP